LPGARPTDAAYATDLPLAPSNRLYVLDSAKKEVLCIADNDFDGLPDAQYATFATARDFPALETTKSLGLCGLGDGGDIALSADDLRSDDVVSAPADVVVLFDDDGPG